MVSSPTTEKPATPAQPAQATGIQNVPLRIYRNHYGLCAEQVHDGILFTTMRCHSGRVGTSLSRVMKQEPGLLVSEPIANTIKFFNGDAGRITQAKLAEIHKTHFQMFLLEIEFANLPS